MDFYGHLKILIYAAQFFLTPSIADSLSLDRCDEKKPDFFFLMYNTYFLYLNALD